MGENWYCSSAQKSRQFIHTPFRNILSGSNPSWQLSTKQPLAHSSPLPRETGEKNQKKGKTHGVQIRTFNNWNKVKYNYTNTNDNKTIIMMVMKRREREMVHKTVSHPPLTDAKPVHKLWSAPVPGNSPSLYTVGMTFYGINSPLSSSCHQSWPCSLTASCALPQLLWDTKKTYWHYVHTKPKIQHCISY